MGNFNQLDPWQMLRVLPGNVFWLSREGVYQGCNEELIKQLNFASLSDIIGKRNCDFLPLEVAKEVDANNELVMQSGLPKVFDEENVHDGGVVTYYLSHKIPLFDDVGNVNGLLGVALDITEKKQLEASLRLAKEKAEAANRVKTEFIGNMSHDLRTPLSGMVGMSEIILERSQESAIKEYARMLVDAGAQLSKFVDRILECCQIEHTKHDEKDIIIFEPQAVLREIEELMRPVVSTKKLKLTLEFDSNIPAKLIGKQRYLYQIILNLVGNAVKFTQQGSIHLAAYLQRMEQDGVVLQFVVQDTGIGIAPEHCEMIFDAFSRISPSYKQQHEGIGLGLFLVRQYAEDMGGSIAVESVPDQGSLFICTLPFGIP